MKRAAAVSAAVVGIALIGSGCSEEAKDKAGDISSSASSAASAASSAVSSAIAEPSGGAAPSTTTMAGEDGKEYTVSGAILEKYNALSQEQKDYLKEPEAEQKQNPDGGVYQEFDGGVIISHEGKTHVVWGKIRDKWNELGGSQGELGYPTSDETETADGGKQTTFQHGTITWKTGEDEATVTKS